jgi:trk system potassium uptake protein
VGDILTLHVLKKGKLAIVEVDLPENECRSCAIPISGLDLPSECVLISIIRGDDVIVPKGSDVLQPGDSIIAVTSIEKEETLKKKLTS